MHISTLLVLKARKQKKHEYKQFTVIAKTKLCTEIHVQCNYNTITTSLKNCDIRWVLSSDLNLVILWQDLSLVGRPQVCFEVGSFRSDMLLERKLHYIPWEIVHMVLSQTLLLLYFHHAKLQIPFKKDEYKKKSAAFACQLTLNHQITTRKAIHLSLWIRMVACIQQDRSRLEHTGLSQIASQDNEILLEQILHLCSST